jgi:hypothetical protein
MKVADYGAINGSITSSDEAQLPAVPATLFDRNMQ